MFSECSEFSVEANNSSREKPHGEYDLFQVSEFVFKRFWIFVKNVIRRRTGPFPPLLLLLELPFRLERSCFLVTSGVAGPSCPSWAKPVAPRPSPNSCPESPPLALFSLLLLLVTRVLHQVLHQVVPRVLKGTASMVEGNCR